MKNFDTDVIIQLQIICEWISFWSERYSQPHNVDICFEWSKIVRHTLNQATTKNVLAGAEEVLDKFPFVKTLILANWDSSISI